MNVEQARALYGIQRAQLLPAVALSGGLVKTLVPADLSTTGSSVTSSQYNVNLGISSWEIDFFGRIRSLKDQALEQYLSTDEARRSAQIMLVSGVAQAYVALAADKEALKLVSSTLTAQEATYKLIRKRQDVGLASELDIRRAQTQVETARVDVARYTQFVAQDENALNLLIGSPLPQELLPEDLVNIRPAQRSFSGLVLRSTFNKA